MKISGKIILVTGGANGIGKALCEKFHSQSADKVFVADIDMENAEKVAAEVCGKALELDVSNEANCTSAVEQVLRESGRIDLVCSNAGIAGVEGFLEVPNEVWKEIYEINVLSHIYLARAAFPAMIEQGEGAFCITASAAGLLSHPTAAPYAVSKHAAVAMAENLSIDYGEKGIYVSCLCPQGVKTAMIADKEGEPENFLLADAISAEECADAVVAGLDKKSFLILPHREVGTYIVNKAENYDRWLHSLRKMRASVLEAKAKFLNAGKGEV